MNKYKVVVRNASRTAFVETLLEWGAKGATLDKESIPRLVRIPYTATLEFLSKGSVKVGSFIGYSVLNKHLIYTKDQLEKLTIDELRDVSKVYEITGRDKTKIIRDVLEAQQAYLKENGWAEAEAKVKPQPKQTPKAPVEDRQSEETK